MGDSTLHAASTIIVPTWPCFCRRRPPARRCLTLARQGEYHSIEKKRLFSRLTTQADGTTGLTEKEGFLTPLNR